MRRKSNPWVTVLESQDPALIAVAESVLRATDIEYRLQGKAVWDLYPIPVRIQVARHDEDAARELLHDLEAGADEEDV